MIEKIFRYCENRLPQKDLKELYNWVNESENNRMIFAKVKNYYAQKEISKSRKYSRSERERILEQIFENQGWYRKFRFRPNIVPVAVQLAMSFVVVVAILFGMNRFNQNEREKSAAQYLAANVKSANKKAILVLSNGQEMLLGVKEYSGEQRSRSKSDRFEAEDDGTIVMFNNRVGANGRVGINDTERIDDRVGANDQVAVNDRKEARNRVEANGRIGKINSISTELGGYYSALLPDGSEVWINSKSKLSFPDNFGEKQRRVTLEGEAFFSVKKIDGIPFIVEIGDRSVKVLGTEFNLKVYKDEPTLKLSLVKGAVEFNDAVTGYSHTLSPKKELVFDLLTGKAIEREFDPYVYSAWKEGYFLFEESNLKEIVQMISRWYNITVKLESEEYNSRLFNGKVSRDQGIMPIMSKLQLSYKFRYYMEEDILIIK